MDVSSIILKLLAVMVLVGINAYFVATEFALVAVRRTRIEQRLRGGDKRAKHVAHALDHPDQFISAAQLGITVASIAIGYIAEDTIAALILPYVQRVSLNLGHIPLLGDPVITGHIIATLLTIVIVTYLHVVVGEQVPKMIAIQKAETVALWTTRPTQVFGLVFRPLIRIMSGSASAIIRLFGMEPTGVHSIAHSPEEIRLLVEQSQQEGEIEAEQEQMIHGVFEFPEIMAREVMTPRPDIVALEVGASLAEVVKLLIEEGHSRIPVFEEDLDNIVGILLVKDLLPYLVGAGGLSQPERSVPEDARPDLQAAAGGLSQTERSVPEDARPDLQAAAGGLSQPERSVPEGARPDLQAASASEAFVLREVLREPYFVPDTKRISELLAELRTRNVHLAIILDEFGGTEGLVTLEDLLEQIVGDIYDEYDQPEPDFTVTPEGDVLIDGGASIDEVNEKFGMKLSSDDYDTIGGYIFGALGRVPQRGDAIVVDGSGELRVEGTEERRITHVRLVPSRRRKPRSAEDGEETSENASEEEG